jgi:hypothetical protein
LQTRLAELRRFPANFQSNPGGFLCYPDWVAEQGANLSLPNSRELIRNFWEFRPPLSFSNLHILQEKHISGANSSREFSELYQGIKNGYQGISITYQGIWIRGLGMMKATSRWGPALYRPFSEGQTRSPVSLNPYGECNAITNRQFGEAWGSRLLPALSF